ncbi:MAG: hypothetical protein JEZ12_28775, partial [Desulfobacterium sp.]|nr:hypothetical protein [Desulfobacterium sp.]
QMALTIAETGTYTLLVQDYRGDSTGEYDIYYVNIPGANEHGKIGSSDLMPEAIDLGDIDTYTFSAAIGDTFEIQVSDSSTNGTLIPYIEVYGPQGDLVSSVYGHNTAYIENTASKDGIYTLVITDYSGSECGEYWLSYYNDADPIDYCHNNFDDDRDIDGEDLLHFTLDYDTIHIYDIRGVDNFAASFGKMDCEESE